MASAQTQNDRTEMNLRYTDKFECPITRILARSFSVNRNCVLLPSDSDDRQRAKDFGIIIKGREYTVMSRMRRNDDDYVAHCFDKDFTLREGFKSNAFAVTEMDKVFLQGFGDILFYGLDDSEYNVYRYRIMRVSALRKAFRYDKERHALLSRATGSIVGRREQNKGNDDTFFWTFPLLEMPDDLDFKCCGSEPLPRKSDPNAGTFFEGLV